MFWYSYNESITLGIPNVNFQLNPWTVRSILDHKFDVSPNSALLFMMYRHYNPWDHFPNGYKLKKTHESSIATLIQSASSVQRKRKLDETDDLKKKKK